jgi:hypothetical protein
LLLQVHFLLGRAIVQSITLPFFVITGVSCIRLWPELGSKLGVNDDDERNPVAGV